MEHFSLKLDTFLPQTAINYPVAITGAALGVGEYQMTLNLTYGQGKMLHSTSTFSITRQQLRQIFRSGKTQAPLGLDNEFAGMPPWQLLLVAGAGLVLLWTGGTGSIEGLWYPGPRQNKAIPVSLSFTMKPGARQGKATASFFATFYRIWISSSLLFVCWVYAWSDWTRSQNHSADRLRA